MPDKQFSENMANRFDGFGSAPSDAVWTGIESQLVKDERKRRFIIWWFAGVLALGVISTVLIFTNRHGIEMKTSLAKVSTNENSNAHSKETDNVQSTLVKRNSDNESTGNSQETQSSTVDFSETSSINSSSESFPSSTNGNELVRYSKPNANGKVNSTNKNTNRSIGISAIDNTNKNKNRSEINSGTSVSPPTIGQLNLLTAEVSDLLTPARKSAYFIDKRHSENKWLLGLRFSQFITVSPRVETGPGPVPPPPTQSDPNSLADLSAQDYTAYDNDRKFEAELFIQRQFNHRLNIATGITGSFMKRAYTVYTDDASSLTPSPSTSLANKSYWNVGIPIRADYYLISRKRFQFGGGISFLTEYGFVNNYSPTDATNGFNGLENIALVAESKERALQLSIQPYLRANYLTLNRWNFFLEAGYRKNILDASESSKYTLPGYVTFTGGLTWEL